MWTREAGREAATAWKGKRPRRRRRSMGRAWNKRTSPRARGRPAFAHFPRSPARAGGPVGAGAPRAAHPRKGGGLAGPAPNEGRGRETAGEDANTWRRRLRRPSTATTHPGLSSKTGGRVRHPRRKRARAARRRRRAPSSRSAVDIAGDEGHPVNFVGCANPRPPPRQATASPRGSSRAVAARAEVAASSAPSAVWDRIALRVLSMECARICVPSKGLPFHFHSTPRRPRRRMRTNPSALPRPLRPVASKRITASGPPDSRLPRTVPRPQIRTMAQRRGTAHRPRIPLSRAAINDQRGSGEGAVVAERGRRPRPPRRRRRAPRGGARRRASAEDGPVEHARTCPWRNHRRRTLLRHTLTIILCCGCGCHAVRSGSVFAMPPFTVSIFMAYTLCELPLKYRYSRLRRLSLSITLTLYILYNSIFIRAYGLTVIKS